MISGEPNEQERNKKRPGPEGVKKARQPKPKQQAQTCSLKKRKTTLQSQLKSYGTLGGGGWVKKKQHLMKTGKHHHTPKRSTRTSKAANHQLHSTPAHHSQNISLP